MSIRRWLLVFLLTGFSTICWALDADLSVASAGGREPAVAGSTNLPDGTIIIVTVTSVDKGVHAQSKAIVSNGKFMADAFMVDGDPIKPGNYVVLAKTLMSHCQSEEVREVFGTHGSHLTGSSVVHNGQELNVVSSTTLHLP